MRLTTSSETYTVIVKVGVREVPPGTFASILKQAGITRREFEEVV